MRWMIRQASRRLNRRESTLRITKPERELIAEGAPVSHVPALLSGGPGVRCQHSRGASTRTSEERAEFESSSPPVQCLGPCGEMTQPLEPRGPSVRRGHSQASNIVVADAASRVIPPSGTLRQSPALLSSPLLVAGSNSARRAPGKKDPGGRGRRRKGRRRRGVDRGPRMQRRRVRPTLWAPGPQDGQAQRDRISPASAWGGAAMGILHGGRGD